MANNPDGSTTITAGPAVSGVKKKGSAPSAVAVPTIIPEQQTLLQNLLPTFAAGVSGIPQELLTGFPTFDQGIPGINQTQQLSLAGLEQLAMGNSPGISQTGQNATGAVNSILTRDPNSQIFNDYFRNVIQDPLLKAFNEDVRPQFKAGQIGQGNLFSRESRQGDLDLQSDVFDTLGRERSAFAIQNEALRLQAAQIAPLVEGIEPNLLAQLLQTSDFSRQVQISQRDAALQEFLRQLSQRDARLGGAFQAAAAPTRAVVGLGAKDATGTVSQAAADAALTSVIQTLLSPTPTGGGTSTVPSQSTGGINPQCWIAAEYFGWFTEEWTDTRDWIMYGWSGKMANLFRRFYLRFGERLAKQIKAHSSLKAVIWPIFQWAHKRGKEMNSASR